MNTTCVKSDGTPLPYSKNKKSAYSCENVFGYRKHHPNYTCRHFFSQTRATNMVTDVCTVTFIPVPMRSLVCDNCDQPFRPVFSEPPSVLIRMNEIADRFLMERFLSYAFEDENAIVLVVTSDKDLSYAMRDLLYDGYTVLSACEIVGTDLALASSGTWLWSDMERGLRCLQR